MYLKHKIYGKLFNLFTKFSINDKQISFILDSSESFKGNLDYIKKEFDLFPVLKDWLLPDMYF